MLAMNRSLTRTSIPKSVLNQTRHSLSTSTLRARDFHFRPTDFQNQGYTGTYEPGQPTVGPLGQASKHGAPRLTPALLKEHLDKYVVGQDKAKKVTAVAIYNHYQRIRELQRQEEEELARREQEARWELRERERNSRPVENEYPVHIETVDLNHPLRSSISEPELGTRPLQDDFKTIIEKSNILLLGPSGVGKTYILSTLARILEVPFTTVDCSSLTQAGYIGTDIESSVERLLLASSHSISKCETGIIFFDEVDKLAKPAIMTHGRDVSGEGVQQGLLKMIEGTTVTVTAKSDRSSKSESRVERGRDATSSQAAAGKSEQYTIDTTNILFVFAGAFVGLEKIISSRISTGSSLGFGAALKPSHSSKNKKNKQPNILTHVTPADLQTYGLIPELLGRIPIVVSLSPLSLSQLVSILTEPRNSLTKQFIALFKTYGIQLRFTTGALHSIAERALSPSSSSSSSSSPSSSEKGKSGIVEGSAIGIGARGLRSILENVLAEIMFWGPGSGIRFCLVDEGFVRSQSPQSAPNSQTSKSSQIEEAEDDEDDEAPKMPRCWSRGQSRAFEEAFENEEEGWRARSSKEASDSGSGGLGSGGVEKNASFERSRRVGSSGM